MATINEYDVGTVINTNSDLYLGSDNKLWFSLNDNTSSKIAKIDTSGTITKYTPGSGFLSQARYSYML